MRGVFSDQRNATSVVARRCASNRGKPQQRVGQRRNTTSGISGCCAAHCTWLRLPRSWTWSGVPRRCSSAARWHGYQVSQRAFANREQGGDARRRGVRLDGCACDIRPGAHLVTAHTFDGRHPAVGQAVTIRRRFAVSRHSMMRTSGLRRLGGYFTESLLIACRYCRRPPPTACQWPWRTSGRQHIDRGPGAGSTRLRRRRDNPRRPTQ